MYFQNPGLTKAKFLLKGLTNLVIRSTETGSSLLKILVICYTKYV